MGACFSSIDMADLFRDIGLAIGIGLPAAHVLAEVIVIATHTPRPGSAWERIYGLIEVAAGLVGRAKESGALRPAPGQFDRILKQAELQLAQLEGIK